MRAGKGSRRGSRELRARFGDPEFAKSALCIATAIVVVAMLAVALTTDFYFK